jgi:hypothetical protein
METQTRFDLNAALENWRQELAAQPGLAADNRRELEAHLRDAIAGFQQRGLNDEESFLLARHRIGQPQRLGEEFEKADPAKVWRERIFWMVLFYFLMGTLSTVPWFMGILFSKPGAGGNLPASVLVFLLRVSPLIAIVLLGAGKMTRQFSRLIQLVDGRFRLASAAFILILISSVLQYFGIMLSDLNFEALQTSVGIPFQHHAISIGQILPPVVALFILALLLIWLMPAQNRKTPKPA